MKKLPALVGLFGLAISQLWGHTAHGAGIEPSQAFVNALKLAETAIQRKHDLVDEYRIYEVTRINLGKFDKGSFGDYSVTLGLVRNSNSNDVYHCTAVVKIEKVNLAKQPFEEWILEEVANDYQILGRVRGPVTCVK